MKQGWSHLLPACNGLFYKMPFDVRKAGCFPKTNPEKQGAVISTQEIACVHVSFQLNSMVSFSSLKLVVMGIFTPLESANTTDPPQPQLTVGHSAARH